MALEGLSGRMDQLFVQKRTIDAIRRTSSRRSVELASRHREAGFATRPRRVPRIAGHVLAAQGGVGVLVADEVAQLLEPAGVAPRHVDTARMDVWGGDWHPARIPPATPVVRPCTIIRQIR